MSMATSPLLLLLLAAAAAAGRSTEATTPQQAAVLLGGSAGHQVESWPCSLSIPQIPLDMTGTPAAAVLGNRAFLCGGWGSDEIDACVVLEDNAWSDGPTMTEQKYALTINNVGHMLVAIGGFNGTQQLATVETLWEGSVDWVRAHWSLSSPRSGHCTVVLSDSEIIVAGGYWGSHYVDLVEKYNIFTGEVEVLPPLATAVQNVACALWDGNLVVAGGSYGNSSDSVEMLDLETYEWTAMPSLNHGRASHTMAVINDALVVFGGQGARDTLEVFAGGKWLVDQLQAPRDGHAMVQLPCP